MPLSISTVFNIRGTSGNSATYFPGAFTTQPDALILALIGNSNTAPVAPSGFTIPGLNFTQMNSWMSGSLHRMTLYRAYSQGTGATCGVGTISWSGGAQTGMAYGFVEVLGAPPSTDGSSALIQYNVNYSTAVLNATVTLNAPAGQNNGILAWCYRGVNAALTKETGYTSAATDPGYNTPTSRLGIAWNFNTAGTEYTPSMSWSNSYTQAMYALEIQNYGASLNATVLGTHSFDTGLSRLLSYIRVLTGDTPLEFPVVRSAWLLKSAWTAVENYIALNSTYWSLGPQTYYVTLTSGIDTVATVARFTQNFYRSVAHDVVQIFSISRLSNYLRSAVSAPLGGGTVYTDNFNRADISDAWDYIGGGAGTVKTFGGSYVGFSVTGSPEEGAYYTPAGDWGGAMGSQYAQATWKTQSGFMGVAVRGTKIGGVGSYVALYGDLTDSLYWGRVVGGVWGGFSGLTGTLIDGDTLRLEARGTYFYCYKNGVNLATYMDNAAFAPTGGQGGLAGYLVSTGAADDWSGGQIGASGGGGTPATFSVSRISNLLRTITSAIENLIALGQSVVGSGLYTRTAATVGSLLSVVSRIAQYLRSATSVGNLNYVLQRIARYLRSLSHSVSLSAALSRATAFARSVASVGSLASAVTRTGQFLRTLVSQVVPVDTVKRIGAYVRSVVASVGNSATASRFGYFARTIGTAIGLLFDLAQSAAGSGFYTRWARTRVDPSDQVSRIGAFLRVTVTAVVLVDSVSRLVMKYRNVSTAPSIDFSAKRIGRYTRAISEIIAQNVVATAYRWLLRRNSTVGSLADALSKSATYVRGFPLNLSQSDLISRKVDFFRNIGLSTDIRVVAFISIYTIAQIFSILTTTIAMLMFSGASSKRDDLKSTETKLDEFK